MPDNHFIILIHGLINIISTHSTVKTTLIKVKCIIKKKKKTIVNWNKREKTNNYYYYYNR